MASRRQRELRYLEQAWRERFGQPPPIRTDPKLMRAVLEQPAATARAQVGEGD